MATNSPFAKFIAEAAAGDITRALVKEGEQGSETLEGWLRILVVDTGEQLPQTHWEIETVETLGSFGHLYSVIALDSDDNPHIAYQDYTTEKLKYAYKSGDSWVTETVDNDSPTGEECAIALDSDGNPHISYYYEENYGDGVLRYAYKDNGGWHITTVDDGGVADDNVGDYSGIAIDSGNYPHIVYINQTDPQSLEYAYKDAGGWNYEVIDTNDNGWNCAVVLDGSDYPHVSYQGFTNGTADTRYAYKDGSGWHTETAGSDGDHNILTSTTVIRLDSSGYPHIAYTEYFAGAKPRQIYYARKDAGGWHTEAVDNEEAHYQLFGFDLDADDLAHISYYDLVNDDMKYAERDAGGNWTKEIADSGGNVGCCCSLALDSDGMAHIAYCGWTENDLKYAKQAPGAYFYIPIYTLST